MTKDDAFIEYLHELLDPLGKISNKKMFGGHGVYCIGVIMGLVIDETLYLKVDEQSREFFSEEDCEPFVYQSKAKQVAMSYWSVPESDGVFRTNAAMGETRLCRSVAERNEGNHEKKVGWALPTFMIN